jgi:plastocyanin
MKRILFLSSLIVSFYISSFSQTTHEINISDFTFIPNDITIASGDKVSFNGSSDHPILEVSMDTWNSNENTALSGGFSIPSGVGEKTFSEEGTHYYVCENHFSSGMKGKITISTATTIDEANIRKFSIYPNPLDQDYVTIILPYKSSTAINCAIYDLTGKLITQVTKVAGNKKITIDCSDFTPGIYIVQINFSNTIYSSKLVKK